MARGLAAGLGRLGKPYVWGGTNDDGCARGGGALNSCQGQGPGWNCSGLTEYVITQAGKPRPPRRWSGSGTRRVHLSVFGRDGWLSGGGGGSGWFRSTGSAGRPAPSLQRADQASSARPNFYHCSMHRPPEARPPHRGLRWASAGLLVTFLLIIAVITLSPVRPDEGGQIALARFIILGHRRDGLPLWITFGRVEFAANVAMLLPIGFFGALTLTRARWLIVPAAIAGSAVVEVAQALALPARDGTPRDVISNGLGALLGYLIACAFLRSVGRREWLRTIPLARDVAPMRVIHRGIVS